MDSDEGLWFGGKGVNGDCGGVNFELIASMKGAGSVHEPREREGVGGGVVLYSCRRAVFGKQIFAQSNTCNN